MKDLGFIGCFKTVGRQLLLIMAVGLAFNAAHAEQVTKEQIKGLDEQVQDIKRDVLGISAELNLLEEKLLFPSNTQISFFVSLEKGSNVEPDSIQIKMDDMDVAHHIYSFKEVEALSMGGVQKVFTGNVRNGNHNIEVSIIGRRGGSKKTDTVSHTFAKGVGPKFVEIHVSNSGIEFKD